MGTYSSVFVSTLIYNSCNIVDFPARLIPVKTFIIFKDLSIFLKERILETMGVNKGE